MGFVGRTGVAFGAVGSLGSGIVPGADLIAFGGGLLATLDPSDSKLIMSPLPREPYAPGNPLWGVARHPDDAEWDLEGLDIVPESNGGSLADDEPEYVRARLRWEWQRRGRERRYLAGHRIVIVRRDGTPYLPGSDPHGTGLDSAEVGSWSYRIVERERRKSLWERELLEESTVAELLERMLMQELDARSKPPVFHELDRRSWSEWAWAYFSAHARPAGSLGVRVERADGTVGPPVPSFNAWRAKAGAVRALYDVAQLEESARRDETLSEWSAWRLEVEEAAQLAAAQAAASDAARAAFEFDASGLGPFERRALGLEPEPSTPSGPRRIDGALIAAALAGIILAR